jgi:hypothetical protein
MNTKEIIYMSNDKTNYTMIDVSYDPGHMMKEPSYLIVLSRGGVNGSKDTGIVTMEPQALESFIGRARDMLDRNTQEPITGK